MTQEIVGGGGGQPGYPSNTPLLNRQGVDWLMPSVVAGNLTTIAGVAGRVDVVPMVTRIEAVYDRIECAVTTAVAGAAFHFAIYQPLSGGEGVPGGSPLVSFLNIPADTAAIVVRDASFSLQGGALYWLLFHHSSTATLRGIPAASLTPLSAPTGGGTAPGVILRPTAASGVIAYNAASLPTLPAATGWSAVNAAAPFARIRRAAL